jgi:hypothetical protein
MSGINRFLSRRDKHHRWSHHKDAQQDESQQEKVMQPAFPSAVPTPASSSTSSPPTVSGTSTPLTYTTARSSSSTSVFSLSLAFPNPKTKRSPRLQAVKSLVQSTTANTYDHCVLQPKITSGHLHGLFTDFEESVPEKDGEQKVRSTLELEVTTEVVDIG